MSPEFWITTAAIFLGPVSAVLVAQGLQNRERRRDRKLFVLRSLLSTRKAQLSIERVTALNLVELEFADKPAVLERFRQLMATYGDASRWESRDVSILRQINEEVDEKSVRLIDEIARSLGYKYDQIDILRGGYYPRGLGLAEEQQQVIREFLVGLREGKLALPVAVLDYVEKVRGTSELPPSARGGDSP